MKLLDLVQFSTFRDSGNVKVLRHRDTTYDLWHLREAGRPITFDLRTARDNVAIRNFDDYQARQGRDVFGNAQFIMSFIAERQKYAKFVGVWEVVDKARQPQGGCLYSTKELKGFEELERRLVIQWGPGMRSWAQWLHKQGNKRISEILPVDYVDDFRGYYDFTLRYSELVRMIRNPESNREWYRMLSSVAGVYLLLDEHSGEQYVGSAYGVGGVWSRWKQYAKNPSGGNVRIRDLLKRYPGREKHFQFSILRVLEPGIQKDAVIAQEVLVKRKLGSRAFGLNSN